MSIFRPIKQIAVSGYEDFKKHFKLELEDHISDTEAEAIEHELEHNAVFAGQDWLISENKPQGFTLTLIKARGDEGGGDLGYRYCRAPFEIVWQNPKVGDAFMSLTEAEKTIDDPEYEPEVDVWNDDDDESLGCRGYVKVILVSSN